MIGHIIERVVPASGFTLALRSPRSTSDRHDGESGESITLPAGTIIGMNPWLIHRNTAIFGPDPDDFVPERWLQGPQEATSEFEARIKTMRDADMSFGNGNRTCLGKPLALVELYKVAATLFGRYKVCFRSCYPCGIVCEWGEKDLRLRMQVLTSVYRSSLKIQAVNGG